VIVFDLHCARAGHQFEGWFGSSEDYESQRERGLLGCPICGDSAISKALMAPSVGAKSNQRVEKTTQAVPVVPVGTGPDLAKVRAVMEGLARAQSNALKDSEWVGRKFADMARAMHYGEQEHRSVHGEVAPEEARALIEEGVEVSPLPFPVVPPEAQN
jgi:hypothetical protein